MFYHSIYHIANRNKCNQSTTINYLSVSILLATHICSSLYYTDCSIKGQVIGKCASHPDCAKTCKNRTEVGCIQQCIPYGCECPDGTVIDEQKNECVAESECPGMSVLMISYGI